MASTQTIPRALSKREEEIVQLSIQGLTNDAIAYRLGLSVGTVNTYWMRIRLKVGGAGRTDTVAKIVAAKAEKTSESQFVNMANGVPCGMEHRAALAIVRATVSRNKAVIWAVDRDLVIHYAELCETQKHQRQYWCKGNNIYSIFGSEGPGLAVYAHEQAISGVETYVRLGEEWDCRVLHAIPLKDEADEVVGCLGVLTERGYLQAEA
jgi:DNA-binding CsgD family transcriptional regulator